MSRGEGVSKITKYEVRTSWMTLKSKQTNIKQATQELRKTGVLQKFSCWSWKLSTCNVAKTELLYNDFLKNSLAKKFGTLSHNTWVTSKVDMQMFSK